MRKSTTYRKAANAVLKQGAPASNYFYQAIGHHSDHSEAAFNFAYSYFEGVSIVTEPPEVRALALCFLAAIAQGEEAKRRA